MGRITENEVKRDRERISLDISAAVGTVDVILPMRNNYEFLSAHAPESLGIGLLDANFKVVFAKLKIDFDGGEILETDDAITDFILARL